MNVNTPTKRQMKERLWQLELDIRVSECFGTPRETAKLQDEACALEQALASGGDYTVPCRRTFLCDICKRRVSSCRQIHEERGDSAQMWRLCNRCTTDQIPDFRGVSGEIDYL
jgi:hypothetical protein